MIELSSWAEAGAKGPQPCLTESSAVGALLGPACEEVKSDCFPEAALHIPLPEDEDGSLEGRDSASI